MGDIVGKRTLIERKGKPEHDSEYLRVKMEYNLMAMDPGNSREDSLQIIDNDLPRTFSHDCDFFDESTAEGRSNKATLRNILQAFTVYRPDIGYVQGMSYLAGFLLIVNAEFETFVLFSNLITTSQMMLFYKFDAADIIL